MRLTTPDRLLAVAAFGLLALTPAAGAQQPSASTPAAATAATAAPATDQRITVEAVRERLDAGKPVVFVDARGNIAGATVVKGAAHVPVAQAESWAADVPKDAFVVAYCACATEGTSLAFANKLRALGFTNVYALKGGIKAWETAGLPTETGMAQR
jgi:rhodanese-related sulfurtransferase